MWWQITGDCEEVDMSFECPSCDSAFDTKHGLDIHYSRMHTIKKIIPPKEYSTETLEWLTRRSTENLFLHFGTDISTYGRYVKRKLRQDGMIVKMKFTEKALKIMRGVGLEPVIHEIKEVEKEMFPCPKCDLVFDSLTGLNIHDGHIHRKEEICEMKNKKIFAEIF